MTGFIKSDQPVFIVGPSRSGTTLLYRILQKHSVFKPKNASVGVDLTESQVFTAPKSIYSKETEQRVGAYPYMLYDGDPFDEFVGKLRWTRHWQNLIGPALLPGDYNFLTRRLLNYRILRLIFWNLYQGPRMARAFFNVAAKARGAKRILEKTPAHLHRLPEIISTYPEAKVVCIVRHPIDIFTSYRRRFQTESQTDITPADLAWLKISPAEFCTGYKKDEGVINYRNSLDHSTFICVRYEDLTNHPQDCIQQILTFLGEPFEQQCLDLNENQRMNWKVDPHLFGEIKTKTKDWQEYITTKEAAYIERSLALPMKRLGYGRYTQ